MRPPQGTRKHARIRTLQLARNLRVIVLKKCSVTWSRVRQRRVGCRHVSSAREGADRGAGARACMPVRTHAPACLGMLCMRAHACSGWTCPAVLCTILHPERESHHRRLRCLRHSLLSLAPIPVSRSRPCHCLGSSLMYPRHTPDLGLHARSGETTFPETPSFCP